MPHTEPAAEDHTTSYSFTRMSGMLLNISESLVIHDPSIDIIQQTSHSFNHLVGQALPADLFLKSWIPGEILEYYNLYQLFKRGSR